MHDMIVPLYNLDNKIPAIRTDDKVLIRKPIGPEKRLVIDWVRRKFNGAWASETDVALSKDPPTCFIALVNKRLAGFACYDATALGYFGPTGVLFFRRRKGIGTLLLLHALHDMRNKGYGYAIIGGVGPARFYEKVVGAIDIPESTPGIWETWLK